MTHWICYIFWYLYKQDQKATIDKAASTYPMQVSDALDLRYSPRPWCAELDFHLHDLLQDHVWAARNAWVEYKEAVTHRRRKRVDPSPCNANESASSRLVECWNQGQYAPPLGRSAWKDACWGWEHLRRLTGGMHAHTLTVVMCFVCLFAQASRSRASVALSSNTLRLISMLPFKNSKVLRYPQQELKFWLGRIRKSAIWYFWQIITK